jgi:(E)-4-hydroxy-3-methylbut-2-enyl-diphosphate synthase
VHFSPERAIEAIEAGAAKIRLNPGNIKNREDIHRVIDAAKSHKAAIRIGVNEASIRDLNQEAVPPQRRTELMLDEMRRYIRLFEDRGFDQLVLSAKSSDAARTIEVNRRIAESFRYPLHLGLTHAGLPEDARIPSAIALGTLLAEGIGDTIRVSAASDPVIETRIAAQILVALGLRERSTPELIVCPTCGRTEIDIIKLAKQVEKALRKVKQPVRVAVMGCVVNGPGEAADADFAICAAKGKAYFYRHGRKIATVPETEIIPKLLEALSGLS